MALADPAHAMRLPELAELIDWLASWSEPDHAPTPRELAEVLWLAKRIPGGTPNKSTYTTTIPKSQRVGSGSTGGSSGRGNAPETGGEEQQPTIEKPTHPPPLTPSPFFPEPPQVQGQEPLAHLLPLRALPTRRELDAAVASLPVRLQAPRWLPADLSLLRALRPLMQRSHVATRQYLDEEATAERSADQRMLLPVFRPTPEPRFTLTLLVDRGLSMEVWQPMAEEFRQVLERSRAFRDVQEVSLIPPNPGESAVGFSRPGSNRIRWVLPDKLRSFMPFSMEGEGRDVLLLLSDTAGPHWWNGSMFVALAAWSRRLPVALLHMLPLWMAQRTALRAMNRATIRNSEAAAESARYRATDIHAWDESPARGGGIPVLRLETDDLANWAAMAMGDASEAAAGVVLPQTAEDLKQRLDMTRPQQPSPGSQQDSSGEDLWDRFRRAASPEAQRLMVVLAAAPILTLPVMRLLKESTFPKGESPLPLVEVLLGGLLRPAGPLGDEDVDANPSRSEPDGLFDAVQYAIQPAVMELLRRDLSTADTVSAVRGVSDLLERRWNTLGTGYSFDAVLSDPELKLPPYLKGVVNFATATAELIERLPGEAYQRFAAQLRHRAGAPVQPSWPASMRFEDMHFETAQLLRIPEPEVRRFEWARYEEIELVSIGFTTASIKADATSPAEDLAPAESESDTDTDAGETIEAVSRSALEVTSWKLSDRKDSTWGYQEPLPPGPPTTSAVPPALTMLRIPTGSFLMGTPETEPERFPDEGPQHQVHLQDFFLSRTPITQAQWRQVAKWEPRAGEPAWKEELDPEPVAKLSDASQFLGDQRPVVNVSWHDAMEFCRRLRLRTGKCYTLPSEAQWEYACRAGTTTPFHFGETITPELANYDATKNYADGPTGDYRQQTTEVTSFPANDWGLHDMHGNVWEWCEDHWHDSYSIDGSKAPEDGSAWIDDAADKEQRRLLRGGSWSLYPWICRSACRYRNHPDDRNGNVGFRVCCLPQDFLLTS